MCKDNNYLFTFLVKGNGICQNMPLWHEDYVELIIFKKTVGIGKALRTE